MLCFLVGEVPTAHRFLHLAITRSDRAAESVGQGTAPSDRATHTGMVTQDPISFGLWGCAPTTWVAGKNTAIGSGDKVEACSGAG